MYIYGFHNILYAIFKVYQMGGVRSTMVDAENKGKRKEHLEDPKNIVKESDNLEEPVDARIALKDILTVRRTGFDWIYLAVGNMILNPLVP